MNNLYRIIIFLLAVSFAACASTPSNIAVAVNDEDKDIGLGGTGLLTNADGGAGSGLGGTGLLANADAGSGLGGTGVVGEITGFGSVFVNGIEIEYDNETPFTINGTTAAPQQLEIGDVVEVLTTDDNKHTQAQVINLRHEVIGKVESIEPQTFSFTVNGQSVVQAIHKVALPEVGATVAVSGFRIDEQTILATRVTPADSKQILLRTYTELPFKGKAARWLVQTHVSNDKATFKLDGVDHAIELKQKTNKTLHDRLGIKILKLQKPASGQLELGHVVEPMALPRGRQTLMPGKQPGNNMMPGKQPGNNMMPGKQHGNNMMPGAVPGSVPGSMPRTIPGSIQGSQSGAMPNMKR
ncbi:MAG: hypothetical protein DRQ44_08440 [Gammaproteobacteria bacterium]|nr:MAG: hypothetical protein DRQ44_08440 [Gammaproteobacteria bacterium]